MRLLNIKRLKTEKQHAVYRILVTTLFTELAQSDTPEKPAGNVDGKNCVAFFGQIIQDQSTISLLWPGFLAPKRMCLICPKMELTYTNTSVSS